MGKVTTVLSILLAAFFLSLFSKCTTPETPLETRTGQVYHVGTKAVFIGPVGGFHKFRTAYFANLFGPENDGKNLGPDPLDDLGSYGMEIVGGYFSEEVTWGDTVEMKGYVPVSDSVETFYAKEVKVIENCRDHFECERTFPQLMGR